MRRAFALLALAALLVTASVAHAAGLGKVLATDTAHGTEAIASEAGSIDSPQAIFVKVTASPKQDVLGSYSTICSKGTRTKKNSVEFDGTSPVTVKVQASIPGADTCSIGAAAGLSGSGSITVKIFGR
ncbi:MAG TPA: hypothetical protein VFX45_11390 [Solirubrobacterales bacterium]|nr:hypothetical protein [Solirubrobacterales bacterium]